MAKKATDQVTEGVREEFDCFASIKSMNGACLELNRRNEHFSVSTLGQHLSLSRKFSALNHPTNSCALPPPQKKTGLQSPRAFICFTLHWINPMCAYGYLHTHIHMYAHMRKKRMKRSCVECEYRSLSAGCHDRVALPPINIKGTISIISSKVPCRLYSLKGQSQ